MLATSKRSICPETIIVVNHALNTTSSDGGRNSFVQRFNDRLQIPAVDRTGVQGSHWLPRMGLVYYTAIDDFSKYARPGCLRLSVKSYTNRRSYSAHPTMFLQLEIHPSTPHLLRGVPGPYTFRGVPGTFLGVAVATPTPLLPLAPGGGGKSVNFLSPTPDIPRPSCTRCTSLAARRTASPIFPGGRSLSMRERARRRSREDSPGG